MNVNWFPGHMAKANKQILNSLNNVDVVLEVLDARIPISSRNPEFQKYTANKKIILAINKCDLSDSTENSKWLQYFSSSGIKAFLTNGKTGQGLKEILDVCRGFSKKKVLNGVVFEKRTRLMIIGIPNVGKSSIINGLLKGKKASVQNVPGHTQKTQWYRLNESVDLLDTPGVLWPKSKGNASTENLALCGVIKDHVFDEEELASLLLGRLLKIPEIAQRVKSVYGVEIDIGVEDSYEVLKKIGAKSGKILKDKKVDFLQTSKMILKDFRNGKFGRITLEKVE